MSNRALRSSLSGGRQRAYATPSARRSAAPRGIARAMSRARFAVAILIGALSCRRSRTPDPRAASEGSEIANQRLHDHIINDHRTVRVERLGSDIVWSDSALLERARALPRPIEQLINGESTNPSATRVSNPN